MPSSDFLCQIAAKIAIQLQAEALKATKEKLNAQTKDEKEQTALDAANCARNRLSVFESKINGKDQCPYCWMLRGEYVDLRPMSGGTSTVDRFRCPACGAKPSKPIN